MKDPKELELYLQNNYDDLEAWAVLGDYWLERDHPRGEIISLTLRAEAEENVFVSVDLAAKARNLSDKYCDLLCEPLIGESYHDFSVISRYGYILHLDMYSYQDELCKFLRSPNSKLLRSLYFSFCLKVETVRDVLSSLNDVRLKHLSLKGVSMGRKSIDLIAECECLSSLKDLDLRWNNMGDEGARTLARSKYLSNLENLDLRGNGIGHEGWEAIESSILDKAPNCKILVNTPWESSFGIQI